MLNASSLLSADPALTTREARPQSFMDEKLKQLYKEMLKLRLATKNQRRRTKRASSIALSEACEVACTIDLQAHDTVAVSSRQIGVGAASQLEHANSAERLLLAAGVAFGYRSQHRDGVVVVFTHGVVDGSAAFAFEQKLPIIYVEVGVRGRRSVRARGGRYRHQLPRIPVDRNDAIAIYRVAFEAIDKARRGVGPTIIQCVPAQRQESARGKGGQPDPLESLEWHLRKKKLWSDEFRQRVQEEVERQFDRSSDRADSGDR